MHSQKFGELLNLGELGANFVISLWWLLFLNCYNCVQLMCSNTQKYVEETAFHFFHLPSLRAPSSNSCVSFVIRLLATQTWRSQQTKNQNNVIISKQPKISLSPCTKCFQIAVLKYKESLIWKCAFFILLWQTFLQCQTVPTRAWWIAVRADISNIKMPKNIFFENAFCYFKH